MTSTERLRTSTELSLLAEQHFVNGDDTAGAELLWGALSQVIIAIAMQRGQRYQEHQHRRHVMRQIIAELDDPVIVEDYKDANRLHVHFYLNNMTDVQVRDAADTTHVLINRLLPLTA